MAGCHVIYENLRNWVSFICRADLLKEIRDKNAKISCLY